MAMRMWSMANVAKYITATNAMVASVNMGSDNDSHMYKDVRLMMPPQM